MELIEKYHLNKDDVIFTYDSHQDQSIIIVASGNAALTMTALEITQIFETTPTKVISS